MGPFESNVRTAVQVAMGFLRQRGQTDVDPSAEASWVEKLINEHAVTVGGQSQDGFNFRLSIDPSSGKVTDVQLIAKGLPRPPITRSLLLAAEEALTEKGLLSRG